MYWACAWTVVSDHTQRVPPQVRVLNSQARASSPPVVNTVRDATNQRRGPFRTLSYRYDGGWIRYDRICTSCDKSASFIDIDIDIDIDRAYHSPEGVQVVVTEEQLAQLPAAEKNEIPVLAFVLSAQIDPILLSKSYFLEPAAATPKAYVLLAKTLAPIDRTAIVMFTLRHVDGTNERHANSCVVACSG